MGSKMLVLLALSIAFALLISSEVTARDLSETTPNWSHQRHLRQKTPITLKPSNCIDCADGRCLPVCPHQEAAQVKPQN
ncbi:hypothetical protein DCAR_0522565 [Daucus carota subsp. sativus]|uniref:4Fe-4S ferredoxin-type domain-containing protein n=1 Tax=Daucus carota subsp. sativus TaxID=79200 RepID=A0AAF1B4S1_DAUCS|nr:hypothetical protein DCAR_0522565 [Daucus carota subsp. sativus]